MFGRKFYVFLLSLMSAFFVVSCSKDKPVAKETEGNLEDKGGVVYVVDTLNSRIEWKGYKVFKSDNTSHFGEIKFESGDVTANEGKLTGGKFVADMASLKNIDLKDDEEQKTKLENHLKDKDFFEVERFPNASYEITKVTPANTGDYNTILDGNLTIKGITKPTQFKANVNVSENEISIATEPQDVNREDFGVKFQMPVANGIVKNEMNIQILIKALVKK